MNESAIKEEEGLLDGFLPVRPEKGRLYHALTATSICYILFILTDFLIDLRRFSVKQSDWLLILVVLLLPLLALTFHLISKRIGWFIAYFYYTGIAVLGIFSLVKQLIEMITLAQVFSNWRVIVLTLFTVTVTFFLLSKPVREYFRVSIPAVIIASVIAIITGAILFVSIL